MLRPVIAGGDLKHKCCAEQRLIRVLVRYHLEENKAIIRSQSAQTHCIFRSTHLQNGKVLQNTIHHVLFGQMLQLVYEIDHILAHGRPLYPVHEAAVLESWVLGLHLLHHLLAEGTHLCGTGNGHILISVVPEINGSVSRSISVILFIETTYWLLTP